MPAEIEAAAADTTDLAVAATADADLAEVASTGDAAAGTDAPSADMGSPPIDAAKAPCNGSPALPEICNGLDDDCNGVTDEGALCNDGNPCTADACQQAAGCVHQPAPATCTDNDACTMGDTCSGGICLPGAPTNCDDANECTTDACQQNGGCVHQPAAATCTDNNMCTIGDACASGLCLAGAATDCNDGNSCTNDTCTAAVGCNFAPLPNGLTCSDGDPCTFGDQCTSGNCKASGNKQLFAAPCNGVDPSCCPSGTEPVTVTSSTGNKTTCQFMYPLWGYLPPIRDDADFVICGDQTTAYDTKTGLTWQRALSATGGPKNDGKMNFLDATAYCDQLVLDGADDWRLPTTTELLSALRYNMELMLGPDPYFIGKVFSCPPPGCLSWLWTVTPTSVPNFPQIAVIFQHPTSQALEPWSTNPYVRCVR